MTDVETAWAIARRSRVSRIATSSANGRPSANPLYHVVVRGQVWLGTPAWTLAARNAAADPRVSILFEVEGTGDASTRRLARLHGTAEVRTDAPMLRAYNLRAAVKYVVRLRNARNVWAHRAQVPLKRVYHQQSSGRGPSAVIVVTPTRLELLPAGAR